MIALENEEVERALCAIWSRRETFDEWAYCVTALTGALLVLWGSPFDSDIRLLRDVAHQRLATAPESV